MRFNTERDYSTITMLFNKELVNTVIDNNVILYKLHQQLSKSNSYGETTKKIWYTGVVIPALVNRQVTNPTSDLMTYNVDQQMEVAFLREECRDRNVYPENGDIIEYGNLLYEVHNVNENQFYAGVANYNHTILCSTHLTNKNNLQLERPNT